MNQGLLFFQTFVLGILVAFVFDITRAFRRVFKHNNSIVHLEDTLFWILSFLGVLYFILNYAGGELRFFYFLGILLGFILYTYFFSRYIVNLFVKILKIIIKIIKFFLLVIYKFFYPILLLTKKIYIFFQKILNILKQKIDKNVKKQKNFILKKRELLTTKRTIKNDKNEKKNNTKNILNRKKNNMIVIEKQGVKKISKKK